MIAGSRSIHELLWAVLFLAAMGLTPLAAVVAIAIPYSGVFAKVFSEMLDEAPRDTAAALRDAGALPLRAFLFGLVPRALPDMTGYAFYRFECALRSAAVLGFFGIPTLGLFVQQAFANAHYREVWSYLYAMVALVVATDAWSGASAPEDGRVTQVATLSYDAAQRVEIARLRRQRPKSWLLRRAAARRWSCSCSGPGASGASASANRCPRGGGRTSAGSWRR